MITNLKYLWYTIVLYLFPKHPKPKKTLSHFPRSRKRWTATELDDLMTMYEHGSSISTIADELDRPIAGVRSKLISLGYSTKGGN